MGEQRDAPPHEVFTTGRGAELGVNVEGRRPGEVPVGIVDDGSHYTWMTAAEARRFSRSILYAARASEELRASTSQDPS